jgi:hypothetical protein
LLACHDNASLVVSCRSEGLNNIDYLLLSIGSLLQIFIKKRLRAALQSSVEVGNLLSENSLGSIEVRKFSIYLVIRIEHKG